MILFVNACARGESRTKRIAEALLQSLTAGAAGCTDNAGATGEVEEVRLCELDFPKTTEALLARRDRSIAAGDYSDSYFDLAKQFARAETIVIAAPYWDLSFPAVLKQYIEHINVLGITFEYTPEGFPRGLCKAKKLYYVMTAGGSYVPEEFGFGYIKTLAESFYGIKDVECIKAVGLDILGADSEKIVQNCIKGIRGV